MGSRSKGGYKSCLNAQMAREIKSRPKEKPPRVLVLSRFRLRTRKYRGIK